MGDKKRDMVDILKTVSVYIQAKRLGRLVNFIHVLLGMVLVRGVGIGRSEVEQFLWAVVVFGLLFYGAIYAINNIADRVYDRRSATKKTRVVAQGLIDHRLLLTDALLSILLACALIFVFQPRLLPFAFLFLGLNLLYTLRLKYVDLLLAAFVISVTASLRLALGVALAGGELFSYWSWYLLVWIGQFGLITRKIQNERRCYPVWLLRVVRRLTAAAFVLVAFILWMNGETLVVLLVYCLYYIGFHVLFRSVALWRLQTMAWWRS